MSNSPISDTETTPPTPPPPTPVLQYERPAPEPAGPRPWWVYAIVTVYLLLWALILTLPAWASLAGDSSMVVPAAIFAGSLALCGMALMILPVRSLRRRPVTRRTIWVPVIASGLMAGALIVGAGLALTEYFRVTQDSAGWAVAASGAAVWIGWTVVFMMIGTARGPMSLGTKLHRALLAGSVLELLIAVPTHVAVRRRPECCAGIGTGIGICLGVAVMFVSFGPSVLLLYHRRRKQISNATRTTSG